MRNEELSQAVLSNNGELTSFRYGDTNIRFRTPKRLSLHAPFHALIVSKDGEVIETNMDDIEISIVLNYWNRNKKTFSEAYA